MQMVLVLLLFFCNLWTYMHEKIFGEKKEYFIEKKSPLRNQKGKEKYKQVCSKNLFRTNFVDVSLLWISHLKCNFRKKRFLQNHIQREWRKSLQPIQIVVLRVSMRKDSKMFPCQALFSWLLDRKFIEVP